MHTSALSVVEALEALSDDNYVRRDIKINKINAIQKTFDGLISNGSKLSYPGIITTMRELSGLLTSSKTAISFHRAVIAALTKQGQKKHDAIRDILRAEFGVALVELEDGDINVHISMYRSLHNIMFPTHTRQGLE